jgi:hypothetical protein
MTETEAGRFGEQVLPNWEAVRGRDFEAEQAVLDRSIFEFVRDIFIREQQFSIESGRGPLSTEEIVEWFGPEFLEIHDQQP